MSMSPRVVDGATTRGIITTNHRQGIIIMPTTRTTMQEGDNHTQLLLQEHQMEELRQQLQQHAIHHPAPAPVPVPAPYPAPPHSSSGAYPHYNNNNSNSNYLGRHPAAPLHQQPAATDHHLLLHQQHQHHHHPYSQHTAVRHNSASQASDTLRRRSVASTCNSMNNHNHNNNNNHDSLRGVYSSSAASSAAAAASAADEGDGSVSSGASFRFSGLEMPSTDLDSDLLLNAGSDHPTTSSYFYHAKAGLHHNVNVNSNHHHHNHHSTSTSAGQRLNQSLSNITTNSNHSHLSLKNRYSRSSSSQSRSRGSDDNDDHDPTTTNSSNPMAPQQQQQQQQQQRRRYSFTPQHQLNRRNSRQRVGTSTSSTTATASSSSAAIMQRSSTTPSTSTAASTSSTANTQTHTNTHTNTYTNTQTHNTTVPNRYYISGKSVQTEWSSPTRQRRSRTNTIMGNNPKHHKGTIAGAGAGAAGATTAIIGKPMANHLDENNNNNNSNHSSTTSSMGLGSNYHHHHLLHHQPPGQNKNNNNSILVLPSISIPNGAANDDYRHYHAIHPSQIKPPAFPQRRACVQASTALCSGSTFKWCVLIQIVLVIPLWLYVFDAHAQKKNAKLQLRQYNEEHEHILNEMMWIDQAAKKITATSKKKARQQTIATGGAGNAGSGFYNYGGTNRFDGGGGGGGIDTSSGDYFESYYADNSATEDLRDSVHKLRGQMRDMQYRIQQNSKARITEKYGEGPIRVYIHPEPEDPFFLSTTTGGAAAAAAGNADTTTSTTTTTTTSNVPQKLLSQQEDDQIMTSEVAIELFIEDTPHAVSTFLYQIERGHWKRVQMNWRSEASILSKPGSTVTLGMGDWAQTSRLEFLEQFPIKHCEVSLVQQGQMGVLSLKINLVEVPFQEHEEVCIGRLINDRLILPKSRGYFMAEFTTTPNSDYIVEEEPKKRQQQEEEEVVMVMVQPPKHEPPPPLPVPPGEEQAIYQQPEGFGGRIKGDNLRGRRVERGEQVEDEEGEDVLPGQQIVPPLQPPGEDVPEDGL